VLPIIVLLPINVNHKQHGGSSWFIPDRADCEPALLYRHAIDTIWSNQASLVLEENARCIYEPYHTKRRCRTYGSCWRVRDFSGLTACRQCGLLVANLKCPTAAQPRGTRTSKWNLSRRPRNVYG
jgi:hypothetical protein